ncbi:MAG: polysaccharide biosynthesis C-terminal domain-containing protein [Ruminococcus sp.]|nr:polysaccharide biosynthesis C-terminal domain-containing protein [Ruminococcus sp.]
MNKQSFLKGSAILLGMVLITKALGLIYKIPLTNMLGGSGMAYYSGAFAVFAPLLAASVSGISASVARLTAESCAFGRYAHMRKLRRCAMLAYSAVGIFACLLLIMLSFPLAKAFLPDTRAVWTLWALAPSLVFCAVLSVQRGCCEGMGNMLPTAASEIAETAAKALLGLIGAYAVFRYADAEFAASHGCFGEFCRTKEAARAAALPYAAAAAILGSSLSTALAAAVLAVHRKLRGDGITEEMLASDKVTDPPREIIKRLFAHSLPIAGAAVITTLSGAIDLLTVPRGLMKAAEAGMKLPEGMPASGAADFIYGSYTGLALMICGLVPTFTAMFGKSALPALTESRSRGDGRGLRSGVNSLLAVSLLTALPGGAFISAVPEEILTFLFAGRTAEIACTAAPLRILGAGCIFMSVSLPVLSALQTLRMRIAPMIIMAAGAVIKLAGNLLLIPMPGVGISGAAISTAVSQGAICIAALTLLLRRTGAVPSFRQVLLKPAFAVLLGACTARLTADVISRSGTGAASSRAAALAAPAAGLGIYILSLWLMNVLPRKHIKRYFSKKFRKTY